MEKIMLGDSGWYIEYPSGFTKGDPREGEFWLYDEKGVGQMIVGFDEATTLCFVKAMTPNPIPAALAPKPAQSDEECALLLHAKLTEGKDFYGPREMASDIAAHRTAAEKKARAEAWNEAMGEAFENVRKNMLAMRDNEAVLKSLARITNPYKKEK